MHYLALATDYDGTIAQHGAVDAATLDALRRVRVSGRKLALVTGRGIESLHRVFPHVDLFDVVVGENGGLLYHPDSQREELLCDPPPRELLLALREANVHPLLVGRVIVETDEPHETAVLEVIRQLGLEYQILFNKGVVMVLPSGVNKATGLEAALQRMDVSHDRVVAVGDAENDHALLELCGFGAAVANALPALRDRADYVCTAGHGAGVVELIDLLLSHDLRGLKRHKAGDLIPVQLLGDTDAEVTPAD